jgi:GNAT superfamily N-acetyltransferase
VAYAGPELVTGEHLLDGFDCGKPALNEWLIRHALANQGIGTSRTWVVVEAGSPEVVAFHASVTASILRSSAPKRMRRNQPEEMPAILLARMAVDSRHTRHGLGAALLKHFMLKALEVAQSVGVRVLLIHAKDDEAKSFYSHYGFVESPFDPFILAMLLGRSLTER